MQLVLALSYISDIIFIVIYQQIQIKFYFMIQVIENKLQDSKLASLQDSQQAPKSSIHFRQGIIIEKSFSFQGDEHELQLIVGELTIQQINAFETCTITILGQQIKKGSPKCCLFTFVIGIVCLFPLLLFCCNWWKQIVSQIFKIDQKCYTLIAKIISGKRIRSMSLNLYDNFISKKKLHTLYQAISQKSIQYLQINNLAGAFDTSDQQYSKFLKNIEIFELLNLKKAQISWYTQHYIQQYIYFRSLPHLRLPQPQYIHDHLYIDKQILIILPMNSLNCRFIGQFQKGEMIGQGTYGIVFFAKDKNSNEQLAIKKMKVLDNQDGFPITSLREVKILRMLSNHPNIISLKDVVVGQKAQSVFLVFEYCDIDVYKLMNQMKIDKSTFSQGQIKCLSLQLIKGIHYAHSKYIIHRDLKLTNLLLNKKGILKIADFGLARQFQIPYRPLTRKVVTLWYRAPELLIKQREYGQSVDVWSIGCIIAEFIKQGNPLFQGSSEISQFSTICQIIGYPSKEEWPDFYDQEKRPFRKQVQKCSSFHKNNLRYVFKNASENCIDLLNGMLKWNPERRISLQTALQHPYFYQSPKALFPDQIKVLNKLQFYSKKSNEQLNKKKK